MISLKAFCVVVIVISFLAHLASTKDEKVKNADSLFEILVKCEKQNRKALENGTSVTSELKTNKEDVGCYVKCLLEEVGLINSNYTVNPPVFAALFKNKKLNENAQECLKKHPMQAAAAVEICEISYKFYDCIRQKSPKVLKKSIYLYYQTTVDEVENKVQYESAELTMTTEVANQTMGPQLMSEEIQMNGTTLDDAISI